MILFFWIDLDIYPNSSASATDLLNIGQTVFYAPSIQKRSLINDSPYECSKMFWSNLHLKESYYALNTGLFTMSRENVESFFNWLNKDHSMNTIAWWNDYLNKKTAIKNQVDVFLATDGQKHKNETAKLDWIGTDEMLIEDWLHQINPIFNDHSGHKLISDPNEEYIAKYIHYFGDNKLRYPKYN